MRAAVEVLRKQFGASQRRACAVVNQPRSTQRYVAKVRCDEPALAVGCESANDVAVLLTKGVKAWQQYQDQVARGG